MAGALPPPPFLFMKTIRTFSIALLCVCSFLHVSCSFAGGSSVRAVAYKTTADRSLEMAATPLECAAAGKGDLVLNLNDKQKFQEVEGFGAALTGASCYNLLRMSAPDRKALLEHLFSREKGLGISMARVSIGASDFSVEDEFTWCDEPGLEHFAPHREDEEYLFPILREVYAINPDFKLIGSPWSAPLWMKIKSLDDPQPHNQWTSGCLNPEFYQDYAHYFVMWIRTMESMGFNVHAITVQNEPLNRGNSMSMYMGWEEQRNFIKTALGPVFRAEGIKTKILLFDHNYNYDNIDSQKAYPAKIMADAETAAYVAGTAWHNYGGKVEEIDNINDAFPAKDTYFTEASIGLWNYDFGRCLLNDFDKIFIQTLRRGCKAVTLWNWMLDENRRPYRPGGCSTCYGALTLSADGSTVVDRKSHYFNVAHCSKVVYPGAVRIGSDILSEEPEGLEHVAFKNPDGSYGILFLNSNADSLSLTIRQGSRVSVKCQLPALSTVSVLLEK